MFSVVEIPIAAAFSLLVMPRQIFGPKLSALARGERRIRDILTHEEQVSGEIRPKIGVKNGEIGVF